MNSNHERPASAFDLKMKVRQNRNPQGANPCTKRARLDFSPEMAERVATYLMAMAEKSEAGESKIDIFKGRDENGNWIKTTEPGFTLWANLWENEDSSLSGSFRPDAIPSKPAPF